MTPDSSNNQLLNMLSNTKSDLSKPNKDDLSSSSYDDSSKSDHEITITVHQKGSFPGGQDTFLEKLPGKLLDSGKNYKLYKVSVGEFIDRFPDWKTSLKWDKQRPVNQEKVAQIVNLHGVNDEMESGDYLVPGMQVTVGTINGIDPRIIDGQHRLEALYMTHESALFHLMVYDFPKKILRFLEFVNLNKNTPLPAWYMAITNEETYMKTLADRICLSIITKYPHLFNDKCNPYYRLEKKILNEMLYVNIINRSDNIDDFKVFSDQFMNLLKNNELFPSTSVIKYGLPTFIKDTCKAPQKSGAAFQCRNKSKSRYNGFCGYHKSIHIVSINLLLIRSNHFNYLKHSDKEGHFSLNFHFIEKVLDEILHNKS